MDFCNISLNPSTSNASSTLSIKTIMKLLETVWNFLKQVYKHSLNYESDELYAARLIRESDQTFGKTVD